MRRSTLIFIALLFNLYSFSQVDFDKQMVKKQLDCSDISLTSSHLFIQFYEQEKLDSAKLILEYWENKCGKREPIERGKILLALKSNTEIDSIIDKYIPFIFNYKYRMSLIKNSDYSTYDYYESYLGFIPLGLEYDNFTQKTAFELKDKFKKGSFEFIMCEFYSDNYDTILTKIQSPIYKDSKIYHEYREEIHKNMILPDFHMACITGIWIPTGDLKSLGLHPEIGFMTGSKKNKMSYDFTMSFKFLNAKNSYYVLTDGNLEETDYFLGGYIGFDIGREIWSVKKHSFDLLAGIAVDGFDTFEVNEENNMDSKSTWSYNFNVGIGYRFYMNNSSYVGIRAKYNVVDYTLNNIVDMKGNALTFQFIIGGLINEVKDSHFKNMKYKGNRYYWR